MFKFNREQVRILAEIDNLIPILGRHFKFVSDDSIERISCELVECYKVKLDDVKVALRKIKISEFNKLKFYSVEQLENVIIKTILVLINS